MSISILTAASWQFIVATISDSDPIVFQPLPGWLLHGLEAAANAALRLDTQASARLATWHGKVLCVQLEGRPTRLFLVPTQEGVQCYGHMEDTADCTLTATPGALARLSMTTDPSAILFSGAVRIQGDQRLAQAISEAFASLHIDWEEQLSHLVGDAAAVRLADGWQAGLAGLRRQARISQANLGEYLTEEYRLLPGRLEVDDWSRAVDELRDEVERLEARIVLLSSTNP